MDHRVRRWLVNVKVDDGHRARRLLVKVRFDAGHRATRVLFKTLQGACNNCASIGPRDYRGK